jgi:hypothetical protein
MPRCSEPTARDPGCNRTPTCHSRCDRQRRDPQIPACVRHPRLQQHDLFATRVKRLINVKNYTNKQEKAIYYHIFLREKQFLRHPVRFRAPNSGDNRGIC